MEKPLCLLLIHGFGGSTLEVQPLADLLHAHGYTCHLAQLAGHGEEQKAIQNLRWQQWVDSVQADYQSLAKRYRVVVIGFSMGGLVAAMLNRTQSFAGMVFINTPIYFWHLPQVAKNLFTDFPHAAHYYFVKSAGRVTPYTMLQFLKLLQTAKPAFKEIHCPTLVVQADDDDSVWPQSACFICRQVGGYKQLYRTHSGGHRVLLTPKECRGIADSIIAYLHRLEASIH